MSTGMNKKHHMRIHSLENELNTLEALISTEGKKKRSVLNRFKKDEGGTIRQRRRIKRIRTVELPKAKRNAARTS